MSKSETILARYETVAGFKQLLAKARQMGMSDAEIVAGLDSRMQKVAADALRKMQAAPMATQGAERAARIATGKAGGIPLPLLSRSAREGLKRPDARPTPEARPDPQKGAAARRLRQMERQQAKNK